MLKPPLILGVVNVTPDSFSDGGLFHEPQVAFRRVEQLIADGADVIDLGAESTRPGAEALKLEEEWQRLRPVLELTKQLPKHVLLSVDTYKPELMRRCVDYGVQVINDINGGADDNTLKWLAKHKVKYLAMHKYGDPATMQQNPLRGRAAVTAVSDFYQQTTKRLTDLGFAKDQIWLDPGIGFGKDDAANLLLLQQAMTDKKSYQIVLGVSRKGFIGRLLDLPTPMQRDAPSKMLEIVCMMTGIFGIRTHNVIQLAKMRQLLNSSATT